MKVNYGVLLTLLFVMVAQATSDSFLHEEGEEKPKTARALDKKVSEKIQNTKGASRVGLSFALS